MESFYQQLTLVKSLRVNTSHIWFPAEPTIFSHLVGPVGLILKCHVGPFGFAAGRLCDPINGVLIVHLLDGQDPTR